MLKLKIAFSKSQQLDLRGPVKHLELLTFTLGLKLEYLGQIRSMPWLLMLWLQAVPSHLQPQYWLGFHEERFQLPLLSFYWGIIKNANIFLCCPKAIWVLNLLWSSDALCWHRSRSTLAQVMAWCLMAPSHCLNQYWLIICEVLWHLPEGGNFNGNNGRYLSLICIWKFEKFEIADAFLRGQWVNLSSMRTISL